ncbi:MAG: thiamine pyrophosphate-binding protein [Hyphomicrobiaceae bacterium]|nr:thiamine pyrophosphate-binding protein [Hyphomicrobiaceae bacterium]
MRHGGKILIDQLEAQGATTAFTVPGESFLAALDGLHDSNRIRTIICRQEGGAAMMAEAWGKMTGAPGVCFVTRGPGAANAMSGVHIAQQDSTPMVLFVGLPGERHEDREAFQEIETKQLFSSFVKWAAVIRATERIPEYVSRAFHVAVSGRPGPVVLGLPEDMLSAAAEARDARAARVAEPAPSPAAMAELAEMLGSAKSPLMIVGGPGWSSAVQARIERFAARLDLPVAAAFRFQDYMDNRHPCYVGHAGIGMDGKLAAAVRDADVLIVLGARLGEMTTSGYTLIDIPNPRQRLVHVHPSPDELGTVYAPDLPITATAHQFSAALDALAAPAGIPWRQRRADLRAACETVLTPVATPGAVQLEQVVRTVSDMLPPDGIVANGAGNYAAFVHRYFQYKGYRTQLAPTSGSMGYGLPAAIAAKLADPMRPVVAFAGDGCFMMTSQELATAVQYGLDIVTIVCNNGMYGTIRMHQEKSYPGRVVGTTLINPDFAAFARSFGAHGETVRHTDEFRPAFQRALDAGKPSVIELKIDPEALTPRQSLSQIRSSGARG